VPGLASSPAATAGNENTAVFVGTSGRRVFTAAFAQNPADERLLTELTSLERASWEATIRDDKEFFRGYMAPEFKGFFADGTVAGREEFLRNLDDFHLAAYTMGEVSMMQINEHAVMVLYRASFEGIHNGKRLTKSDVESSSLYVRRDGKWLEIFYQETAIPAPAPLRCRWSGTERSRPRPGGKSRQAGPSPAEGSEDAYRKHSMNASGGDSRSVDQKAPSWSTGASGESFAGCQRTSLNPARCNASS